MTIEAKSCIEIRQVGNGYVVMPGYNTANMLIDDRQRMVFQTFAELVSWLSQHFTHRQNIICMDGKSSKDQE